MEDEIKPAVIKKTQDTLGKFVKKPPLTDKLLRKPPFRFLHDVITAIIRDHGFFKDIFTDVELKSENIKDKEDKIKFLYKAINTMKLLLNADLEARPSKIVAGHEPTKTNEFLQAIGKALAKKLSTQSIAQQIAEGLDLSKDIKFKPNKPTASVSKTKPESVRKREVTKKSPEKPIRKSTSPKKEKSKKKTKEEVAKLEKVQPGRDPGQLLHTQLSHDSLLESSQPEINLIPSEEKVEISIPVEPQVSEPPPPLPVEEPKEEEIKTTIDLIKPEENDEPIVLESTKEIVEEPARAQRLPSARPRSSLRPPSARPVSARPAAPRIRERTDVILPTEKVVPLGKVNVIIENMDKDEDDMVVVEVASSVPEIIEPVVKVQEVEPKGHLVAQILETQKELLEDGPKGNLEIEWEEDSQRNRESKKKYLEGIRSKIQAITRAALPLGQIINFLQEDYDNIIRELKLWQSTNEKLSENIMQQRAVSDRGLEPMLKQFNEIEEEVEKQKEKNYILKSEIYHNQQKIDQLITRLM